jgi:uncharacterized protein YcbX
MTLLGQVAATWRYPVKSLQGLPVDELDIGRAGVVGDRAFGLIDQATGLLLSAKHVRELLEASATDHTVTLPDGTTHPIGSAATDEALGRWLGRPVTLRRPEDTGAVRYRMSFGPRGPERRVVDVPTPEGTYLDVAPVHLLTTASLAAGAAARPDLDWDVRRFRPNLVVDVPSSGFVEDGWAGLRLRVGEAELVTEARTLRCAMPMRAQRGLERTPELFRALVELNDNHLGLYCQVVTPGRVRVGDAVTAVTTA